MSDRSSAYSSKPATDQAGDIATARPGPGKQQLSGAAPVSGDAAASTAGGQQVQLRADAWSMTPGLSSAMGLGQGASAENDPFKVSQGQLTFDAEGTEGGKYHTRKAHWPGGVSGVTIGRGYDLGQHKKDDIIADMTSAGISDADASKFAAAAELKGAEAKAWLDANGGSLPEITPEQQEALFETTYAEHLSDVKRISKNYAKTKGKGAGTDGAEFQIDFDTLHPAIKDILVDLRYRGDYTPATRVYVQPLAIANDLAGMAAVMADREKWKSVPPDRFERRKQYMANALAGAQGGDASAAGAAATTGAAGASASTGAATAGTAGASSGSTSASSSGASGSASTASGAAATGSAAATAGSAVAGTATLKANVNVREQASMNGKVLEVAKSGATFKVAGNTGSWYQVEHKGSPAYITTRSEYVSFQPAPAPRPAAAEQSTAAPAKEESWLESAWNAAVHLVDVVTAFFAGSSEEELRSEGDPHSTDIGAGAAGSGAGTTTGGATTTTGGAGTSTTTTGGAGTSTTTTGGASTTTTTTGGASTTTTTTTGGAAATGGASATTGNDAAPAGTLLFKDAFEVVDANAKLRDAKLQATGKLIPKGTKVYVVKAEKTYVQIITATGAEPQIKEADQAWTAFSNLGGTGADVGLGNESTDAADKTKADELRAGLPSGRKQGQSAFKWQFSNYFQPSLEGKALQSTLMAKVQRLMQWAIENDMVTGDIVIGDGVRGPKTAHKMCVSWNIQYRWGSIITLAALKALPGGKDADGTTWYQEGWGEEEIKANAKAIRSSNKIAAAGYEYGDEARLPLPLNSKPGVSRHCTGRAVDVTIPWRAPGKDASTNATDVWAWEDVYKQFGLHRPLHKSLVSDANLQENWHIEETGKALGDDDTDG